MITPYNCVMKTILITRPSIQAHQLAGYLLPFGFNSIIFPVLSIEPPQDPNVILTIAQKEHDYSDFIFVSPVCANEFDTLTNHYIPTHPRIIAMGRGTAKTLNQLGITVDSIPALGNSSALLELPELQEVNLRKIAIFTGEGGNTRLEKTLIERGALVTVAYTHRRALPHYTPPLTWNPDMIHASVVTSAESLRNFITLITRLGLTDLYQKPLIVITRAQQQQAEQSGFKSAIILADSAHDESIVDALRKHDDTNKHATFKN